MRKLSLQHAGLSVIIVLLVIPAVLWFNLVPFSERVSDVYATLNSLGQITALLGTMLFVVSLVLQTDNQPLQKLFPNNAFSSYKKRTSLIAFLFLVTHPLLMMVSAVETSVSAAWSLIIPGGDWTLNFGIYALFLLVAYYVISYFGRKEGKLQNAPHVLAGVLFLGTLHAFFIPSSLSASPVLKTYMLSIIVCSVTFYLYESLLAKRVQLQSKQQA